MAPTEYAPIAKAAERDANTYQSKTGEGRHTAAEHAGGVYQYSENRFPGSELRTGDDFITNRGDNRRIPPEEGGELDARGRQTRASQFEGPGGPQREPTGRNDSDIVNEPNFDSRGDMDRQKRDILDQGIQANVGQNPRGVGGGKYKGEDYYTPEDVPDSMASQGNIPPSSVINQVPKPE